MNRADYSSEASPTGERLLITGGRGSGKTARLHALTGAHGGLVVPANPHALMTGLVPTVAQEIALGLETITTSRAQLQTAVQEIAHRLGITHLLEANPLELSGGQTQLVALASYLALARSENGKALGFDEPFTGLDNTARTRLLELFAEHPGPLAWASARPQDDELTHATQTLNLDAAGERSAPGREGDCIPVLTPRTPHTVTAHNLDITAYTPRTRWGRTVTAPIVNAGISFDLALGTCLILTGPNGAGKSSLLRTIAGLTPPASGTLTVGGKSPSNLPGPQRVALAQLVAQTPAHHFLASTVAADMRLGGGGQAGDKERALLRETVLGEGHEDTHPLDLLPTQQHLLALAQALANNPTCLLLDEPTAGLDAAGLVQAADLVQAHCAAGGSTIVATHDQELTQLLTERLTCQNLHLETYAPT